MAEGAPTEPPTEHWQADDYDDPDAPEPVDPDWEPEDMAAARRYRLAEVTAAFGENVKAARKARRWNQTDLTQQLARVGVNLHQTTVAKIENGARPTPVHEVWAIASVLGVDYGELLAPVVSQPDRLVEAQHALDRAQRRHAALQADLDRQAAEVQAAAKAVERLTKGKR